MRFTAEWNGQSKEAKNEGYHGYGPGHTEGRHYKDDRRFIPNKVQGSFEPQKYLHFHCYTNSISAK